jgi:hypothetical protein
LELAGLENKKTMFKSSRIKSDIKHLFTIAMPSIKGFMLKWRPPWPQVSSTERRCPLRRLRSICGRKEERLGRHEYWQYQCTLKRPLPITLGRAFLV